MTVAAPTAGATAGYEGGEFVPDFERAYAENPSLENETDEKKVAEVLSKYPKAQREDAPIWGLQGGYYSDIKVPEGTASGFAGRSTSGMAIPHVESGYGPTQSLNSLKNKYLDIDRELSVDAKKVIFVAFSLVDDVQKNNGLSPAAKAKLSAAGYTGDYGKTPNPLTPLSPTFYDTRPQESEILVDSEGNLQSNVTPITAGDTLAEAAAVVAGAAMSSDTNYIGPETYSDPASFDDISTNLSTYVMDQDHGFLEADPSLGEAIINIARNVTTEELAKADLKIRFSKDIPSGAGITNEAVYNPVFFDITNSTPTPVEELPQPEPETPATDLHVTNVEKLKDGNYKVTRNDGKEWVINLKDIRDKITELEKKESPSKAEFDKIKKELGDLKKQVDGLKAADKEIKGDITKLRDDLSKLESRVTNVEARLTEVEGRTDALTQCVAGAGLAGIPTLLGIPLMVMTQLNIPGLKDLNTQIQKQIGMFNPELARQWERNGGVLQAGAALAGLAGMISGIAYIANQCDPMMQTDAAKETDLGQLSSKLEDAKAGSSNKGDAKDTGSSIDAGSSVGDAIGEGSSVGEDK